MHDGAARRPGDNPFRAQAVDRLPYLLPHGGWDDVLDRLADLGHRAAVVGPHGSGKTTFLEALRERLERRGWDCLAVRLSRGGPPPGRRDLPAAGPRQILILDGAEQLGPVAWRLVRLRLRRAGGVVIGTHVPGRLPLLLHTRTGVDLLVEIVARLGCTTDRRALGALLERHGGNVRLALRELYDAWMDEENAERRALD